MKYFAANTKILREKSGYTQAQIATSLGISRTTWIGYESGLSQPNLSGLLNIVKFFDISASDLLEKDLSNVHLNKNQVGEEQAEYVHLKVHPNVHLNTKKAQKGPCKECETKDMLIQVKDQLLHSKQELIEQLNTNIKLLQNHIDTMEYERREVVETQHTPIKERKTA